jgi:hypothetical protein
MGSHERAEEISALTAVIKGRKCNARTQTHRSAPHGTNRYDVCRRALTPSDPVQSAAIRAVGPLFTRFGGIVVSGLSSPPGRSYGVATR